MNSLKNTSNQPSKFRTKLELKKITNQEEPAILIVKSNLKPQCLSLVYVIIAMHIYLLKEL